MDGSDLDTPLSPSLVSTGQYQLQLWGPASPQTGTLCLGRAISRRDQSLVPSLGDPHTHGRLFHDSLIGYLPPPGPFLFRTKLSNITEGFCFYLIKIQFEFWYHKYQNS